MQCDRGGQQGGSMALVVFPDLFSLAHFIAFVAQPRVMKGNFLFFERYLNTVEHE